MKPSESRQPGSPEVQSHAHLGHPKNSRPIDMTPLMDAHLVEFHSLRRAIGGSKSAFARRPQCLPAKPQRSGPSMWERGASVPGVRLSGKERSGCNMCSSIGLYRPPLWSMWRQRVRADRALAWLPLLEETTTSNSTEAEGQPSLTHAWGNVKNVYVERTLE